MNSLNRIVWAILLAIIVLPLMLYGTSLALGLGSFAVYLIANSQHANRVLELYAMVIVAGLFGILLWALPFIGWRAKNRQSRTMYAIAAAWIVQMLVIACIAGFAKQKTPALFNELQIRYIR